MSLSRIWMNRLFWLALAVWQFLPFPGYVSYPDPEVLRCLRVRFQIEHLILFQNALIQNINLHNVTIASLKSMPSQTALSAVILYKHFPIALNA